MRKTNVGKLRIAAPLARCSCCGDPCNSESTHPNSLDCEDCGAISCSRCMIKNVWYCSKSEYIGINCACCDEPFFVDDYECFDDTESFESLLFKKIMWTAFEETISANPCPCCKGRSKADIILNLCPDGNCGVCEHAWIDLKLK